MPCELSHSRILNENNLSMLKRHQMHEHGRHKCCQCAYNQGYDQGLELSDRVILNIENLGHTQAMADGRHKSVHQAFAKGYSDGFQAYIDNN